MANRIGRVGNPHFIFLMAYASLASLAFLRQLLQLVSPSPGDGSEAKFIFPFVPCR